MSDQKPDAWLVEFHSIVPDAPVYAGTVEDGAAAFAFSVSAADLFSTQDQAQAVLTHAYPKAVAELGTVKAVYVGPVS